MAMLTRTAKQIEAIREERRKDPRSRYSLSPHEKRELNKMADKLDVIDKKAIKNLSNYFVVTQGTIAQALESMNFDLSALANSGKVNKPKEPKPKKQLRATLGLNGKSGNPKTMVKKVEDHADPEGMSEEGLRELRTELHLLKAQLQNQESELRRQRVELNNKTKTAEQMQMEAEEALAGVEAMQAAHQEEIERIKAGAMPIPDRDPDATPLKLYTQGDLFQIIAPIKRDYLLRIDGLTRTIGLLEAELQSKEAEEKLEETPLELMEWDELEAPQPKPRRPWTPPAHDTSDSLLVL